MLASNENMYADAYTIQCVPYNDAQNFNYIAGIVPFLRNLIADVSETHKISVIKQLSI